MRIPDAGDRVGRFEVEKCDVGHRNIGSSMYEYPVEIIVSGKGGQKGVRDDFKELLTSRKSAFSGYGTPYQFHFERAEVENLGDSRYRIVVRGVGNRVFLKKELARLLEYISQTYPSIKIGNDEKRAALIDEYVTEFEADARRKNPHIPI